MRLTILLGIVFIAVGCKNIEPESDVAMNQLQRDFQSIKSDVFLGKIDAYNELKNVYMEMAPSDFLYHAMFMANRHDYGPAYFDVYLCFKNDNSGLTFAERDSRTKTLMKQYLKVAAERNVQGAQSEWDIINK